MTEPRRETAFRTPAAGARILTWTAAATLAVAVAVRLAGVAFPAPTSEDEKVALERLAAWAGPGSTLTLAQASRKFPLGMWQTIAGGALAAYTDTTARAAFLIAALLALASLAAQALTAARLFGRHAGVFALVFGALSVFHANFSVKILGVIHAYAFASFAFLAFTSRRRALWGVGGVLLGAAFALHYNTGLLAAALAVGALLCDAADVPSASAFLVRLVRDRAWVGVLAAAVVLLHARAVSAWLGLDYLARVTTHENFDVPLYHSNFHWLWVLVRLDPVVTLSAAGVAAVWLRARRRPDPPPPVFADHDGSRFLTPAIVGAASLFMAALLLCSRSLSGMARQLFLPLALWHVAAAGVAAAVWEVLPRHAPRLAAHRHSLAAFVCALGAAALLLALPDWLATRGGFKDVGVRSLAAVRAHWPRRKVDTADYFDFLVGNRAYALVQSEARPPDFTAGVTHAFPFPYFEEEPYKLLGIQRILQVRALDRFVSVDDLVYTTLFYVTPAPDAAERAAFLSGLPPDLAHVLRPP